MCEDERRTCFTGVCVGSGAQRAPYPSQMPSLGVLLSREVSCCAWSIPVHRPGPWLHREERLLKILLLHKWFCKMQSHRQDPARYEAEFSHFQHPWVGGGRGACICLLSI